MLKLDPKTGLLTGVNYLPSPNSDARPSNEISLIVVHGISLPKGEFGGPYIEKLFLNKLSVQDHPSFESIASLRVSAHVVIDRQGNMTQYVPFSQRAWHAGVSSFEGKTNCNDYSIGIELEGTDTIPYTLAQYHALAMLIKILCHTYPISSQHIVGHSDIAPGRKTDPGPSFDWLQLRSLLS